MFLSLGTFRHISSVLLLEFIIYCPTQMLTLRWGGVELFLVPSSVPSILVIRSDNMWTAEPYQS